MKKSILSIVLILLSTFSFAQVRFGPRYEQVKTLEDVDFDVIAMAEHGALIVQEEEGTSTEYSLILRHLNTDLELQWEESVGIYEPVSVHAFRHSENVAYILLHNKYDFNYQLIRADVSTGEVQKFNSFKIQDFVLGFFEVIQDRFIFGGSYLGKPSVLIHDHETNEFNIIPDVYPKGTVLAEIKVNDDGVTFNVLASELDRKLDRTISVHTYDYEGNSIRDYTLGVKPGYRLINGRISSIHDISQTIVGQYTLGNKEEVAGVYVNHINRSGLQTMVYHNFDSLPNFLKQMGEKRAGNYRNKALHLARQGKEKTYRGRVFPGRIVEADGKLLLTMVCFVYKGPLTHVYTLVLNEQGEIEWGDYLARNETQGAWKSWASSFQWLGSGKGAHMAYFREKLSVKLLDGSGENEVRTASLPLKSPLYELKDEEEKTQRVINWYDGQFLVYGLQQVRPKDKSDILRTVFYINKVKVTGK